MTFTGKSRTFSGTCTKEKVVSIAGMALMNLVLQLPGASLLWQRKRFAWCAFRAQTVAQPVAQLNHPVGEILKEIHHRIDLFPAWYAEGVLAFFDFRLSTERDDLFTELIVFAVEPGKFLLERTALIGHQFASPTPATAFCAHRHPAGIRIKNDSRTLSFLKNVAAFCPRLSRQKHKHDEERRSGSAQVMLKDHSVLSRLD